MFDVLHEKFGLKTFYEFVRVMSKNYAKYEAAAGSALTPCFYYIDIFKRTIFLDLPLIVLIMYVLNVKLTG